MDWNRWESSFDPMFWMTPEERHESVQQEEQEGGLIGDEKHAAEALFNMFQSGPGNSITGCVAASIAAPVCAPVGAPDQPLLGTSFPSADTIPLVSVTNDAAASVHALDEVQVDFEQDMTDAANDYMYNNNHNLMDIDIAENALKER